MARDPALATARQTVDAVASFLAKRPDMAVLTFDALSDYHRTLLECDQELNYLMRQFSRNLPFHHEIGRMQYRLVQEIERIVTEIRRRELLAFSKRKKRKNPELLPAKRKQHRLAPPPTTWVGKGKVAPRVQPVPSAPVARPEMVAPTEQVRHVPWAILGAKIRTVPELQSYLRVYLEERKRKPPEYDMQRIEILLRHRPTALYLGKEEFDGYLVLYFAQYQLAVFECPIVGNALYLIRGDWQTLARRSKAELLHDESGKIKRIIHHGAWSDRLTSILTTPGVE